MTDIQRVLRLAGLRLMLSAFLRNTVLTLTVAIVAVMLLRVATVVLGGRDRLGVDCALGAGRGDRLRGIVDGLFIAAAGSDCAACG